TGAEAAGPGPAAALVPLVLVAVRFQVQLREHRMHGGPLTSAGCPPAGSERGARSEIRVIWTDSGRPGYSSGSAKMAAWTVRMWGGRGTGRRRWEETDFSHPGTALNRTQGVDVPTMSFYCRCRSA